MAESHWIEADRERFAALLQAERSEVPEFTESTIHVVAGLLLPIWKQLPNESTRVYRLQTNAGERTIGRKVSPAWVASALLGEGPTLKPEDVFAALLEGRTVLDLAEGLKLRRVRVMGTRRIELSDFGDTMRDRLRAYGLFSEIISWKLRMFVPTDASGVDVLTKVIERYPVVRTGQKASPSVLSAYRLLSTLNGAGPAPFAHMCFPAKARTMHSAASSNWKQLFKDSPVMSVHSRIGRLFGARAATEEYSVASQLNCVPLVSFRRQITRSEITAEGSR
jgi:hypothetical protein